MKKIDKIYWYCVGVIWLAILLNGCKSTKPKCDSYGFINEPTQFKQYEDSTRK